MYSLFCFFFFSSRRRHTRFDCDWSSDVCSSDLAGFDIVKLLLQNKAVVCALNNQHETPLMLAQDMRIQQVLATKQPVSSRSEERRVGKECRSRRSQYQ